MPFSRGEIAANGATPQYAIDQQGNLYTLFGGTLTSASTSFAKSQTLATGVTHMAMTMGGGIIVLQGSNSFSTFGNIINTSASNSGDVQYALDGAGYLYTLQGGTLRARKTIAITH